MKNLIKAFSFIYILVIFISCHKDQTTPPPVFTDNGNIGAQGGTVKTNDGASVEIPGGALTTNKLISITNVTEGDTSINTGFRIYELTPNGLNFSDSVTLNLPFDDTYINSTSSEKDHGVGIMILQDSVWIRLKTEINLAKKTAKAKIPHFSNYVIYYPTQWIKYFDANRNSSPDKFNVPYYAQGSTGWCSFYSLGMLSRFAGYYTKAPTWAVIYGATTTKYGAVVKDVGKIGNALTTNGIINDVCKIGWVNGKELSGYLINQLKKGFPVWVGNSNIEHAIVVTGHDQTGFYVNDPSGAFLTMVNPNLTKSNYGNYHVTYEAFINALFPQNAFINLNVNITVTLVIKSLVSNVNNCITLNFPVGEPSISITKIDGHLIGDLYIDPQFKPNGFSLINLLNNDNSFAGSDYFNIAPVISNSDPNNNIKVNLHCKIDTKDVVGSPLLVDSPKGNSWYNEKSIKFQLQNLSIGNHTLTVELRSFVDPNIKYDFWEFPFKIASTYSITKPSVNTTPVTVFTATSAYVGGNVTGDGGTIVTESGVYYSTSQNPETTGTKLQIGNGTGPFTTNLSELTPSTSYYIKAYGINSQGPAYGSQVSFTTQSSGGSGIIFNPNLTYGSVSDNDGNTYKTIQIGTQTWMAENLKTTKYKDGTSIQNVTDNNSWIGLTTGAYCNYNNDASNAEIYGRLYNYFSVVDDPGLCPTGWHVPSDTEWKTLETYLGMSQVEADKYNSWRGTDEGGKLKETSLNHWLTTNTGATNSSGFTGLPGGERNGYGIFATINNSGEWHTSTPNGGDDYRRTLANTESKINRYSTWKLCGYSVRCIQDGTSTGTIPTIDLVAYYPLDGNASDVSGNSNNGTIYGGVTSTSDHKGSSGKAMQFNGSTGFIQAPNSASLQSPTNSVTLAGWIWIDGYNGLKAAGIVNKTNSTNYGQYGLTYHEWSTPYRVNFYYNQGNKAYAASIGLSLSRWYFVAATYDGSNINIYVDGVNIGSSPSTGLLTLDNNPLTLGLDSPGSTEYLKGKLDNIRIYNRALTPMEIAALYNE